MKADPIFEPAVAAQRKADHHFSESGCKKCQTNYADGSCSVPDPHECKVYGRLMGQAVDAIFECFDAYMEQLGSEMN